MKPLDSSLIASAFSLGKGGHSTAQGLLPSDALVIVIQDRADPLGLPLLQRHYCGRAACESLPILRRRAERAYSEHLAGGRCAINVSV